MCLVDRVHAVPFVFLYQIYAMKLPVCIAALLLATLTPGVVTAQAPDPAAPCYPTVLYPGQNVVSLYLPEGIGSVYLVATAGLSAISPTTKGCPQRMDLSVLARPQTGDEELQIVLTGCAGSVNTYTLKMESWGVVDKATGTIELGRDTCLGTRAFSTDDVTIDSILVFRPTLKVKLPAPKSGPWKINAGDSLDFFFCYTPTVVENFTDSIKYYIKREQPNGGFYEYVLKTKIFGHSVKRDRTQPEHTIQPSVADPTTFRNILMPSGLSLAKGRWFVASYEVVGLLAGYGLTRDLTVMAGGAVAPSNTTKPAVLGTVGGKFQCIRWDRFDCALGGQFGYTSNGSSRIRLLAGYGVASYGSNQARVSLAGGYAWKHHSNDTAGFDKNAYTLAFGADYLLQAGSQNGWKLAGEAYLIESSGLFPVAFTVRYFTGHLAVDAGVGVNLTKDSQGKYNIVPALSAIWTW